MLCLHLLSGFGSERFTPVGMPDIYQPSVFITGATGLVGSHMARRYLAEGYAVSALKRPDSTYGMLTDVAGQIQWHEGDILDVLALEKAIRPGQDVIHAAAVVSFNPSDRHAMEAVNVTGTANVVNVCLHVGIRRLGFISSVAALGRPPSRVGQTASIEQPIRIDASQKWEESAENSAYAKTKYRAELEVWRGRAEGLSAVIVNPSIVLGVGDWSRSSLQLIGYVRDERPFYPSGLFNYVDVLDVVEAVVRLMQQPDADEARYVLNGGTTSYQAFLTQLANALHKRPPRWEVPRLLTQLLWPLEAVRARLTGRTPLITRETAQASSRFYQFDGQPITQKTGMAYHSLADTLHRIASAVS